MWCIECSAALNIPFAFQAATLLAAGVRPHGLSTLIGLTSGRLAATSKAKGTDFAPRTTVLQ
ncbi:hypothetical protein RINTU1_08380 [Candidatus Regiella insecticola]|uniref:Uncharacterized protein n=1 Tax=Candidatus Regiella insecticola TaxID=138073 RepID=A0A6L2ZLZ4_9ENTR|nr:hypothetical protein RINTU1_08380 [Candidatus Regiella insecticola]